MESRLVPGSMTREEYWIGGPKPLSCAGANRFRFEGYVLSPILRSTPSVEYFSRSPICVNRSNAAK